MSSCFFPPCCHAAEKLAMARVVAVDCVELELRDDATTGIMLFNAHSFSDDHCCRYITRRLCLARAQPRGPLSHLQLHARPVSAHGLPKRTPLDTREFDRPAGALPRPKCRVL